MDTTNYHVLDLIGEGSYGKVYKGRRKFTGQVNELLLSNYQLYFSLFYWHCMCVIQKNRQVCKSPHVHLVTCTNTLVI